MKKTLAVLVFTVSALGTVALSATQLMRPPAHATWCRPQDDNCTWDGDCGDFPPGGCTCINDPLNGPGCYAVQ